MTQIIAFIGIGHLACYMIQGLRRADKTTPIWLLARSQARALTLAGNDANTHLASDPQGAVDQADIIVIATRPGDVTAALSSLRFQSHQAVISVAAGVDLAALSALCAPARAIRSLPLSCVSIQQSPILVYPDEPDTTGFLKQLGPVHGLADEGQFPAATALTGALYAWLFALMAETHQWAKSSGLPAALARDLVQDTFAGAAAMAQFQTEVDFDEIWDSLATPGGISEQGHQVISDQQGFAAFSHALTAVRDRLQGTDAAASPGEPS